jgi:hypothetical protein
MTIEEGKACLDIINKDGLTPLTLAARNGHIEMYDYLLYTYLSRVAWVFGEVATTCPAPLPRPHPDTAHLPARCTAG